MSSKCTPTLTVVETASNPDPMTPPKSLGQAGRTLWTRIHHDFVVEDASTLQRLQRVCEAADTLANIDDEIARDGLTIRTKSGVRENPLLKIQLATRSFVERGLARMNFDVIEPRSELGRPSGGGDYRGERR